MNLLVVRSWKMVLCLAAFACLLAGCVTGPKIDWNTRVGSYTHDAAVTELGPPDKSAKLTDGTVVEEWLISRSGGQGRVLIGPPPYAYSGYSYPAYALDSYPSYEWFLRLTFGPDGTLKSWKKYSK